ncbi:hypothetical protein G7Y89_g14630 [Cudoniella acicularis]|uniref:Prion-inhibition and propagation HeLo domain-containing protein n=1 Tax=Cudoniella acicularis TaxID=354080 RepID=A0A8H4QZU6_9HELO|nr:hypothetical protein G7Y89_g14630 [Cudoniella acicularis]
MTGVGDVFAFRVESFIPPLDSPNEKKSKSLFSHRNKPSSPEPSPISSRTVSSPISEPARTPSTVVSSLRSLYDRKITQGIQDDAIQARALQSSSNLLGRMKWAATDRSEFFSAVEELTRANDLLESLLRIRSIEDETFMARVSNVDHHSKHTPTPIISILHSTPTQPSISCKLTRMLAIKNIVAAFNEIDIDADPQFQCLGEKQGEEDRANLRIYQDRTLEWTRTQTLAKALQDQSFQDICFQKHYTQLGLFMAFSYAALPFMFKGKKFPQASDYVYYNPVLVESEDATSESKGDENTTNETEIVRGDRAPQSKKAFKNFKFLTSILVSALGLATSIPKL